MQRRRPCRFSAGHAQAARRSTRCTRCQTQADRDSADGVAPGKPGEPMSGEPTWDRTNWRGQLCSQGYRARELPFRAALCCVARPYPEGQFLRRQTSAGPHRPAGQRSPAQAGRARCDGGDARRQPSVLTERKSSSQVTRRWRETDSNFWFLVARPSNRHGRRDGRLENGSGSVGNRKTLWGGRRGNGNFVAASNDGVPRCPSRMT